MKSRTRHVRIVLAGKYVARAPHISCELVDFIEPPIDDLTAKALVPKVANPKIIGLGIRKGGEF
jgi:hypothetical protein